MQLPRLLAVFATMATLTSADVITDRRMCYIEGEKWGDNKKGALIAVDNWCINDARGEYSPGLVAYHCENLPNNDMKVELWIQRTINGPALLFLDGCIEMLKNQIHICEYGGEGAGDGWYYRARIKHGNCDQT